MPAAFSSSIAIASFDIVFADNEVKLRLDNCYGMVLIKMAVIVMMLFSVRVVIVVVLVVVVVVIVKIKVAFITTSPSEGK